MRYEAIDYGNPTLNVMAFVGLGLVGLVLYLNVKPPLSNILGVTFVWAPLVILQFINGRPILGIILIVVAGAILKGMWNDA